MASKSRKSHKKLILILTVSVVLGLALISYTFFRLYERGLTREGLFERAERAFRARNYADASRLSSEALLTEPDDISARKLLLQSLVEEKRFAEAEKRAKEFFEAGPGNAYAGLVLCQLAFAHNDPVTAEHYARCIADTMPSAAYQYLALLQDWRGLRMDDWRIRLAAATTMRNLPAATDSEAAKAWALLISGSVMLEVSGHYPPARESLEKQARVDLEEAASAASKARQVDRSFNYDLAMAQIQTLSSDPDESEAGAGALRRFVSGVERSEDAVLALAIHHMRRKEWSEAVDMMRQIKDTYLWLRGYWCLQQSAPTQTAIRVLDTSPYSEPRGRKLLKATAYLRGTDPADVAQGKKLLVDVARDPNAAPGQVLRALFLLAQRFDFNTAREVGEQAGLMRSKDRRVRALLARLLTADESNRARGMEMVRQLAIEDSGQELSRQEARLLAGNDGALEGYLDAKIASGGGDAHAYRLERAMAQLARARREPEKVDTQSLKRAIAADLGAMLDDAKVSKGALVAAYGVASLAEEYELAGRILGRALTIPGEPEGLALYTLQRIGRSAGNVPAGRLAAGLRAAAAGRPAAAYLQVLANAVATRVADPAGIHEALVAAAAQPGSRLPALRLAARFALDLKEFALAEEHARAVLSLRAGDPVATELLGNLLLRRGAYDEVLQLYAGRKMLPLHGIRQTTGALLKLGRKEEAVARAREVLDRFPRSPAGYLLLATTYVECKEVRKALSVLGIAPASALLYHMRAQLLERIGDHRGAERLYVALLYQGGFRDMRAWYGYRAALLAQDRIQEFLLLTSKVLKSKRVQLPSTARSELRGLRGQALESAGKGPEALLEYEAAIRDDGGNWKALNNAAWLITSLAPARIEQARHDIDRALEIKSNEPALLDTAAEVCLVQGDEAAALRHIDAALALEPEGKVGPYSVHKARVLLRFDREQDAKQILEQVRKDFPSGPVADQAKELLWEIERRHVPVEKEKLEPLPPLDDGAGKGQRDG